MPGILALSTLVMTIVRFDKCLLSKSEDVDLDNKFNRRFTREATFFLAPALRKWEIKKFTSSRFAISNEVNDKS